MTDRIYVELVNGPHLFKEGWHSNGVQRRADLRHLGGLAVAARERSTYLKFDAGGRRFVCIKKAAN